MQPARGLRVAALDELQHLAVEARAHGRVVGDGSLRDRGLDLDPAPGGAPQVGRVHALVADQFEDVAVLRKQRDRRHRLAGQQRAEEVGDGEARTLDLEHRGFGAALRLGDEALHRELDGAEHQCGRGMPHHLERADGLVQLLAGHLQRTDLGLGRGGIHFANEAPQRLAYTVKGFLDFSQHPGQRPEVFGDRRVAGVRGRGRGLNRHVGCSPFFDCQFFNGRDAPRMHKAVAATSRNTAEPALPGRRCCPRKGVAAATRSARRLGESVITQS